MSDLIGGALVGVEQVEIDEETRIIAHGTVWQNAASIFFKLVSFIYTVVIARMVSQEEVGVFYFGLGLVGLVIVFSDAGLSSALVRYVPYYLGKKDARSAQKAIALVISVCGILSVIFAAALYLFAGSIAAFFANPPLARVLPILAIYILVMQAYNILGNLLIAFKRVKEASISSNIQNLSKLVMTVVLIWALGPNSDALTVAYAGSFAVTAIYLFYEARKSLSGLADGGGIGWSQFLGMGREMLPFGLTMILVVFIWSIIGYTDRVLLGYMLEVDANRQIAIYTLATGLAGLSGIFAGSVTAIFYPVVSELVGKEDTKMVNKISQTAFKWVLFSSLPVTAFLIAFGGHLLRAAYGAAYEPGYLALVLFAAGVFASLAGSVQRTALAGMRMLKIELIVVSFAALLNILLNVLLIPLYGITGSALASAIALVAMTVLNQHYAHKLIGFSIPKSAWKNLAAGVVAFGALLLLQPLAQDLDRLLPASVGEGSVLFMVLEKGMKVAALGIFFVAGALVYLVSLNLLRVFEREDAAVLRRMLGKTGAPDWARGIAMRAVFWNQKELL